MSYSFIYFLYSMCVLNVVNNMDVINDAYLFLIANLLQTFNVLYKEGQNLSLLINMN